MLLHQWPSVLVYFFFLLPPPPPCFCQSSINNSPQNFETFYPFPTPTPTPLPPFSPPLSPPPSQPPPSKSSSEKTILTAVGATAAATVVLSLIIFLLIQRCMAAKRKRKEDGGGIVVDGGSGGGSRKRSQAPAAVAPKNGFGDDKIIVDEDGLDVIYWRKLEARKSTKSFSRKGFQGLKKKEVEEREEEDEEKMVIENGISERKSELVQEIPLLRGRSSTSHVKTVPETENPSQITHPPTPPPPPPPPTAAAPTQVPPSQPFLALGNNSKRPDPPPLPPPANLEKINNPTPPPPPTVMAGGLKLPAKVPPVPKLPAPVGKMGESSSSGKEKNGQVKMKPLHWDKVNTTNAEHSMVWEKMDGGSFRFDGDLMEALFGYVATNRSPQRPENSKNPTSFDSSSNSQTFILDSRKSQNIAIVIKSLTISKNELMEALVSGQGLETDTLEKLDRIAPTQEEQSEILKFNGDPSKLANAESFLFNVLKAVPTAFTRLKAMLFRLNYDPEILLLKEDLQTLELGCRELKTRTLLTKLLEAILKAGNRMNAGTSRGNAQAFNLTALRKLSDVRSTDGKTSLLHFVVEEVVRSEGKKCALNRKNNSSNNNSSLLISETLNSKEERLREYMKLGLPIVGGLSMEFSNVKKSASIDYNSFVGICPALASRISEIRKLVARCVDDGGRFAREMMGFLEVAENEVKVMKDEQIRVLEAVKKTTEYYQGGASIDKEGGNLLQLFVIVKDFLGMVDRACVEISRNAQRRSRSTARSWDSSSSPRLEPFKQVLSRFPNLPENFMSEKSRSSSSESDGEI